MDTGRPTGPRLASQASYGSSGAKNDRPGVSTLATISPVAASASFPSPPSIPTVSTGATGPSVASRCRCTTIFDLSEGVPTGAAISPRTAVAPILPLPLAAVGTMRAIGSVQSGQGEGYGIELACLDDGAIGSGVTILAGCAMRPASLGGTGYSCLPREP